MEFLKNPPKAQRPGGNVKFDVSEEDVIWIGVIVTRFLDFLKTRGVMPTEHHARNLHMDLGAIHCNGCPLDLSVLMAMEITPFVEDIIGMTKNLDRTTGKLLNFYRPRCAKGPGIIH